MDLLIYKGEEFFVTGKLDISLFQIEENKKCIFHVKADIKNILFVILLLEKYVDTLDALHKNSAS